MKHQTKRITGIAVLIAMLYPRSMKNRRQSTRPSPLASRFVIAAAALALCWAQMAQAQTHTVLKSFTGSDGGSPYAGLVLTDGTLYGTTTSGGSSDKGTVFKVNTDGTGYAVLKSFTGNDGASPYASPVISGDTLYGTTEFGGSSIYGTVFTMNTDGTGYTVLKNFTASNGAENAAGLVLSGGTLYGGTFSTDCDAPPKNGTVFTMNTDGTGYTTLKRFNGSDGSRHASLISSGSTLYGTTDWGGSSGNGTVFKMNTDGTRYTVLKSFAGGSNGSYPWAALVLSGSTLYGTTQFGGTAGQGTVFKVNTDGTGYSVLKSFTGSDGASPTGGLVMSGGALYGTTCDGGSSNKGTVFKVNTDGTGYSVLKSFTDSDGASPSGGLVMSGGALYGTTYAGGSSNEGTVFRIDLSAAIGSQPRSRINAVGSTASFSVTAIGTAPLICQWLRNGATLADGGQPSGATISGATTTYLTIANVQMSDAGDYTVVVTNAYGSVTSSMAALTVQLPTPIVLTADSNSSFSSTGFGFNLSGMAGQTVVIEASTSLTSWTPLLTNSLVTGYFYFHDPVSTNLAQRFYRARLAP
jgi:uncharacterized repeat protein (TIGR03803 family)